VRVLYVWLAALLVVVCAAIGLVVVLVRPRIAAGTLRGNALEGEAVLAARSPDGAVQALTRGFRGYLAAPTPGQLRLRRVQGNEPALFLDVLGVDPVVRPATGWQGMVVSGTGDHVLRIGTPQGLVELVVPAAHVDWYQRRLARG
jgi:hypothetical protein